MTRLLPSGTRWISSVLFSMGLVLLAVPRCHAQYQYVATMNYSSLSVNRLVHVPGIMWVVGDNSTYDANHQRFFFQGNATRVAPWNLYTVDVAAGVILYSPVCPSTNSTAGNIFGLQYDNATDTLYALYLTTTTGSFCWIDPATGTVNIIRTIPGLNNYIACTFDTQHHRYIVVSNSQLWVLDAATGAVLSNPIFSPATGQVSLPQYDNLTGHLYAICNSAPLSPFQFDSVGLNNGVFYPISAILPPMTLPSGLGTVTIDETAGKYIFLGTDPPSACIYNNLYVLDIGTGAILSKTLYPYAQGTSVPTDENVLEYSFDNQRETLYALNWYPPPSTSFIQITAADSPVCAGTPETFTATTTPGLTDPGYQWQWNNNDVGTNSPTYTNAGLADGDSVRCILTLDSACQTPVLDTSNGIRLHVVIPPTVSVTINASENNVCEGDTILFTATPVNGGNAPAYQWEVNGVKEGPDSPAYGTNSLAPGDSVNCRLISSPLIRPLPAITLQAADTVIPYGKEVQLQAVADTSVTSYQWTPSATLNNPSIADPVASPIANTLYQVSVLGSDGCSAKAAIEIKVYKVWKMPNAFTPNGDGRNDIFGVPPSLQITVLNFSVYDRWGERVFSAAGSTQGWDGRLNNKPQPAGVYVWQLEYVDALTGKPVSASGTVMLVR